MTTDPRVVFSWNLLRYAYGAVILLAGLDKIFATNLITDWPAYISPFVGSLLPISTGTFLLIMGIIEVAVALMLLTKFQRIGAYLSVAWLLLISVNLVLLGALDIAIRDILLAISAVVLAQLTGAVEEGRLMKQPA